MTNNIAAMAVKHDNVTESIALELMVALARLGGDAPPHRRSRSLFMTSVIGEYIFMTVEYIKY